MSLIELPIDIETIPDQRDGAFDRYLSAVEPPGNYKKQETIDKWMAENAEKVALEDYLKTGLNGLHGQICSIAFCVNDRQPIAVTAGISGGDEAGILQTFWTKLQEEVDIILDEEVGGGPRKPFARPKWIGHNLLDFDLRFLKQRSIVHGFKPPFFIPADARHGGDDVFDTMKEFAGWRGYVKQDELVEALGIELPEWAADAADVDGSQIWDLYRSGQFALIGRYNTLDVWKVREIYRRMMFR